MSVRFAIQCGLTRAAAGSDIHGSHINTGDFCFRACGCATVQDGLVRINSEVSYQLDHAPSLRQITIRWKDLLHIGLNPFRLCAVARCKFWQEPPSQIHVFPGSGHASAACAARAIEPKRSRVPLRIRLEISRLFRSGSDFLIFSGALSSQGNRIGAATSARRIRAR